MGTEILRPQDCLIDRMRVGQPVLTRRRSYVSNPNPKISRKSFIKPAESTKKESISKKSSSSSVEDVKKPVKNNIVMGRVTILKRGESLDVIKKKKKESNNNNLKKKSSNDDFVEVIVGTERLGPDPEMVPKQIRISDLKLMMSYSPTRSGDVYAGSAFHLSPPPSSLPLPSFYKKQGLKIVDDSATKDLRRLLRLDD